MKKPLYSILLLLIIAGCGIDQKKFELQTRQLIFKEEQKTDSTFSFQTFFLMKESDYEYSGYFTTTMGNKYKVTVQHDGNGEQIYVQWRKATIYDALKSF